MRQDVKKGTALHHSVGSSMFFFSSDSRASKDAKWHLNAQLVRFCSFDTVVFSFFLFFAFSSECPARFFEICGRIGNEMPRERKLLVTKRWVQLDKKTMEAHIPNLQQPDGGERRGMGPEQGYGESPRDAGDSLRALQAGQQ